MLDRCRTQWSQLKEEEVLKTFRSIVDEAKELAKTRREQSTPSPMDVSEIQRIPHEVVGVDTCGKPGAIWNEADWLPYDEYGECEVSAIWNGYGKGAKGKGKNKGKTCFNCGGSGHFQRECPKGKGKGKIKGYWQPAMSVTGKGSNGKGMWPSVPRACFNCGSPEHLANACPNRSVQAIDVANHDPEVLYIGAIANQEAEMPKWQTAFAKPRKCIKQSEAKRIGKPIMQTSNRFEMPEQDEETAECAICSLEDIEVRNEHVVCQLRELGDTSAGGRWTSLGDGEITIDSAADESCWPANFGGAFKVKPTRRNLRLKAANGQEMRHEGEKEITFRDAVSGEVLGMKFQVTEVHKPLAAVWRLAEKGNLVVFGPTEAQCFIQNIQTGKQIPLHKRGGSYVLKVEYVKWVPNASSVFQGRA